MNSQNICPKFEKALSILSKRWSALIIFQLLNGTQRFCDIESEVGVSARVLSERLKDLEKEEIVTRKVYNETPIRIEYSLTEKGKALRSAIKEIQKWSDDWIEC